MHQSISVKTDISFKCIAVCHFMDSGVDWQLCWLNYRAINSPSHETSPFTSQTDGKDGANFYFRASDPCRVFNVYIWRKVCVHSEKLMYYQKKKSESAYIFISSEM